MCPAKNESIEEINFELLAEKLSAWKTLGYTDLKKLYCEVGVTKEITKKIDNVLLDLGIIKKFIYWNGSKIAAVLTER